MSKLLLEQDNVPKEVRDYVLSSARKGDSPSKIAEVLKTRGLSIDGNIWRLEKITPRAIKRFLAAKGYVSSTVEEKLIKLGFNVPEFREMLNELANRFKDIDREVWNTLEDIKIDEDITPYQRYDLLLKYLNFALNVVEKGREWSKELPNSDVDIKQLISNMKKKVVSLRQNEIRVEEKDDGQINVDELKKHLTEPEPIEV